MKKCKYWLLVCLLLAGCSQSPVPTDPGVTLPIFPDREDYTAHYDASLVIGGSVTTGLASQSQNTVSFRAVWAGAPGKDYTDPAVYTMNTFLSGTSGMKWSPLTWETADDSYILGHTTTGFYDLALNREGNGFTIVDEMAVGLPKDVTEEYAGQFGILPGETARAWLLELNPAACWENGEAITADTYVYSYQQLLDGKMMNRRADSVYAGEFAIVGAKDYLYGKATWEQVGILKTGEYQLVLITTAPVRDPDFYVPYYLMDTYLVYQPLWEQCKTYFDKNGNTVAAGSDAVASITTNYATSLDTSISYGPYKLTYFELDKQITLERNESWFGYHDDRHQGQYQTDRISCQIISNHATALLAFLNGDLDSIGLQAQDMADFSGSPYLRYLPQSYTTKLTFNTSAKALSARGAQVLSNVYFRQAFSLAIDRTRFAAAYTSAGEPGYGILNHMYIYDPYTGATYRGSEGAKNALVRLYGLEEAPFGGLEGAYRAITGYDPEKARGLMQLAYEQCVKQGLYDGESPITLQLSVYQAEDNLVQMFHFLQDAMALACKGTGFAGKITLQMAVDADYYATMESGLTDMIFSTWGGSSYDPYGVLYRCYCDAGAAEFPNQMEYGFDAGNVDVALVIDGETYRASLQTWARWVASDTQIPGLRPFREYDAATRCKLYADLEFAYLSQYVVTPLYYRNSAQMLSQKGDYPTATYVDPVEFGGIRFYTYFYDDTAWNQIKSGLQY